MQRLLTAIIARLPACALAGLIDGGVQVRHLPLLRELGQLLLLLLLRIGSGDRVYAEWQHASELAGSAADGAAEARVTEDAANRPSQWLADLTNQVAEPSLRRDLALLALLTLLNLLALLNLLTLLTLLTLLILLGLLSQLLNELLGHLSALDLLLLQLLLDLLQLLQLLLYLLNLLLLLWRGRRARGERQHAAQLPGHATNGAAQARMAEQAADGAARLLADLAEQIAKPPLRRQWRLLCLLCLQSLLHLGLLYLLRLLRLLCIRGVHRIHVERQHPAELPRRAADRAAEARVAKDAANRTAQGLAYLTDQVAEPSLGSQLGLLLLLLELLLELLLLLKLLLKLLLLKLLNLLLLGLLSIGRGDRVDAERQDRTTDAAGILSDLLAEVGVA